MNKSDSILYGNKYCHKFAAPKFFTNVMRFLKSLLFLLSILYIHSASGQDYSSKKVRIGIAAGANFSNISHSKSQLPSGLIFEKNNKLSHSFGLRAIVPVTGNIEITTGLNYNNLAFELIQTSFGNDSLMGTVQNKLFVQSWELPLLLTYQFKSNKKWLNNTCLTGGVGFSFDHYTRFKSTGMMSNIDPKPDTISRYSYEVRDNLSSLKRTFNTSILLGVGKEFNLSPRKSLQINLWYAQGFRPQAKAEISYLLMDKYYYPLFIKPVISSFRLEFVYLPWKL